MAAIDAKEEKAPPLPFREGESRPASDDTKEDVPVGLPGDDAFDYTSGAIAAQPPSLHVVGAGTAAANGAPILIR
jgi:hypothetical protein